ASHATASTSDSRCPWGLFHNPKGSDMSAFRAAADQEAAMTNIEDVSPTKSNTNVKADEQSVTGRMLALACSPDGQVVFAGSYSNIWRSVDSGQTWDQDV